METNVFKKVSEEGLQQLAPDLYALYRECLEGYDEDEEEEEEEDEDEEEESSGFIYAEGDIRLNQADYRKLRETFGFYTPLAINGNLQVEGRFTSNTLVNGDLHCDTFYGGEGISLVKGTIFARHHAAFIAEDHEVLRQAETMRLNTPYIFSWFYDLSAIKFPEETVIFLLCDYGGYKDMGLTNLHFFWQDDVFVLKPGLCYKVGSRYSDALYWNFDAISKMQEAGQSLFIEGFNISSLSICQQASRLHQLKQYREAFDLYSQVILLSPLYYVGWVNAGNALFLSGAYEQAIPYLEKAAGLFPQRQKELNNRAADLAALCCVRLRRLDEAIRWADFSIESSRDNRDDRAQLYFAYRIRGEVWVLQGEWEKARADLEQAVNMNYNNGSANWLMGLVYHHQGNAKKAKEYHDLAQKAGAKFAAAYDTHGHTDFVYPPPVVY